MVQLLRSKYLLRILFIFIIFIALYIYNDYISTDYRNSKDTKMRMAVLETLGGPAMPIIAQCCTSRNLTEGIYARRSDLPGGFCFHSDCDVVATIGIQHEKIFTFNVIKK